MIHALGTCSSCYQYYWVWFTFILKLLKITEFFRKWWGDYWGAHRAKARRINKVKRIRSPSIISLVLWRFGRVNSLVMSSWEKSGFMKIFISWLRMQASPPSSMTSVNSISYSPIRLCKIFISMLGGRHLRWNFIYMMSIRRSDFMIFAGFVGYPLRLA